MANTKSHPLFPDLWKIQSRAIAVGYERPTDPDDAREAQRRGISSVSSQAHLLLPGQVLRARKIGTFWLEILPTRAVHLAQRPAYVVHTIPHRREPLLAPFWPSYRVFDKAHPSLSGVQAYHYDNKNETETPPFLHQPLWDPHSEYTPKNPTSAPVGHLFLEAERPTKIDPRHAHWWTNDGTTWWPKHAHFPVPLPERLVRLIPPTLLQPTTQPTVILPPQLLNTFFTKYKSLLTAVMIIEYLWIVVGAFAGVELGWTLRLQLWYAVGLVLLFAGEYSMVEFCVPNGSLWLRFQRFQLHVLAIKSILWRLDVYGDVGFAILAYQQRDRFAFWPASVAVGMLVVGGRLGGTLFYLRRFLSQDEVSSKTLSYLSIPSFTTVFQALGESMHTSTTEFRHCARRELVTECLRLGCEDVPEIGIQALYLFGSNAPGACGGDCSRGFVIFSMATSIATAFPGMLRIVRAYGKYRGSAVEDKEEGTTWRSTNDVEAGVLTI